MYKFSLFLLLILLASCSSPIRVLHYNIKEYDNAKIQDIDSNQNIAIRKILKRYPFDILSLNEVQFDLPNHKNLTHIKKTLDIPNDFHQSFNQANTGNKAKKDKNGEYLKNFKRKDSRNFADPVNFGIFPGQYSTGALFKYKKLREVVITDLSWKKFNPNAKINTFRNANGRKFPKDMQLFDKNFTDVVVDIEGKEVHLILLHTVPAYHFGNKKSPNYERNGDQLRFLEWYLTGRTDIEVSSSIGITPLNKDDIFIAIGDWNTEPDNQTNPGSKVLRRLFKKIGVWTNKFSFTNEGSAFSPKPFRLMLDYIAFRGVKLKKGKIIHPEFKTEALTCGGSEPQLFHIPVGMVLKSYYDRKQKQKCWVLVNQDYVDFITASDHYPIYAEFELL